MTLLEKKNEAIDFTAFYEVLDLYQTGAVEVMWEEGMPIPITPKNYNTNESR